MDVLRRETLKGGNPGYTALGDPGKVPLVDSAKGVNRHGAVTNHGGKGGWADGFSSGVASGRKNRREKRQVHAYFMGAHKGGEGMGGGADQPVFLCEAYRPCPGHAWDKKPLRKMYAARPHP